MSPRIARPIAAVAIALVGCSLSLIAFAPSSASAKIERLVPANEGSWFISPMKVRTVPAMTYLAMSGKTSFGAMGEDVPKMSDAVRKAIQHGVAHLRGPTMLVYNGTIPRSEDDEFTIDVGMPVSDGAKSEGDVTARSLPEFKCATVVLGGSLQDMQKAYGKLLEETASAGLEPTGERREHYLQFNGHEADDNIVVIELGVK